MNKDTRKKLINEIRGQLDDSMMPMAVGGHTITDQYVYAGCSQWEGCGRDWEETNHAKAWIVDGRYQLTFPDLSYFNGQNDISRQTQYYLQPDRSESPPSGPIGEPLMYVPDIILLEIAKGLADAIAAHDAEQSRQDKAALELVAKLESA